MSAYSFTPDANLEALLWRLHRRHRQKRGAEALPQLQALLQALGNPHNRLPPVFHAAGTNGKGSTLAFLQAVFEAAGLRVHKYTSPHLVRFEERVVLSSRGVVPAVLADYLMRADALVPEGGDVGFFGLTTAAAFAAFAEHPADAVLLETGVGGLLDPTNLAGATEVAIITRISADHQDILGRSLVEIAQQKAGIIKQGRPVVTAPQPDADVAAVIARTAKDKAAPVYAGWHVEALPDGQFVYSDARRRVLLPQPALPGDHQLLNAGAALAAIGASRYAALLDDHALLARAMQNVRWPARLQRLQAGALVDGLPDGWEIWLDGAHNDSGGEVLAQRCRQWQAQDGKPLHLMAAFKDKKEWQPFFRPLQGLFDSLHCLQAETDALTASVLIPGRALWAQLGAEYQPLPPGTGGLSALAARDHILARYAGPRGGRILIAGSLYLAGHILRHHR